MKSKLAIDGTRNPKLSYKEWEGLLLQIVSLGDLSLIVSGGATGIDTYANLFASRHHIPLMEFIPDYAKYGKLAPLLCNRQIVKEATMVIAFPSSESRGTFHSISEALKMHKPLVIKQI